MRRLAMVIPVVFALSASPALGANTTTVDVGLNGSTFTQPDVTIPAGDKIHWVWDAGGHTVTSGAPFAGAGLKPAAMSWRSRRPAVARSRPRSA